MKELFEKYLRDQCSAEEIKNLLEYFEVPGNEMALKELILQELLQQQELSVPVPDVDQRLANVYSKVTQQIRQEKAVHKLRGKISWKRIAAAAAIVMMLGSTYYLFLQTGRHKSVARYANDIAPGKNSATLTLANGTKIVLSDAANGKLAEQAGVNISKTDSGQLVYEIKDQQTAGMNVMNTLTTANGETYRLRLPDQSEVWLNAASSIRFPASFASLKQRRIELSGEAYFEIAPDAAHPFIVKTDQQEVQVLGTRFNINSYKDADVTVTTLLDGSVRVADALPNKGEILKPGQQAIVKENSRIMIMPANIKAAMAWKNGYFRFNNGSINEIMLQLGRWYNIEVRYEGKLSEERFSGNISRNKNISEVLDMLSYSNAVKFKVEGRIVTVMP